MSRIPGLLRWAVAALGLALLLGATFTSWRWYAGMEAQAEESQLAISEGLAALRELPALALERAQLLRRAPRTVATLNAASLLAAVDRASVHSGATVQGLGTGAPAGGSSSGTVVRLAARGTLEQVAEFIDTLAAEAPGRMENPVLVWRGATVDLTIDWEIPNAVPSERGVMREGVGGGGLAIPDGR